MHNLKITVIGCGNLGLSLVQGLIRNKQVNPKKITATKRNITPILFLKEKGIKVTDNNNEAVKTGELIIVAVKPYNLVHVFDEIKDVLDPNKHLIVSVATGITTDEIYEMIQKPVPIFRAMPNIATDINESITCLYQRGSSEKDREKVEWVFSKLGTTLQINEDLMEAATILGACGVAFVLRFIRAMIQGGIQIGFDADTAKTIVNQTVKGAAEMLIVKNDHPEREIDKVTTPKGCTIVGLNEMEHQGFSSSLIRGIVASFERIEK